MPDVFAALATDGGREFVRALGAGLAGLLLKVPALWRRSGQDAEERMAAELERSAAELAEADAGGDETAAAVARTRAETVWETRLRDLLAAHPEARAELAGVIDEIRRAHPLVHRIQQNITASGQNSTAQGVIGGTIHNYAPGRAPYEPGHQLPHQPRQQRAADDRAPEEGRRGEGPL